MVARWRALSAAERRLLVEAGVALAAASALVRLAPFRTIARLASRAAPRAHASDPATIGKIESRWGFPDNAARHCVMPTYEPPSMLTRPFDQFCLAIHVNVSSPSFSS